MPDVSAPGAPDWHSRVEAPLRLPAGAHPAWADHADVIIIGLGGAGVCAALEALDAGASVIAIDRFDGGGATRLSGGIVYAGGGTPYQREAGVNDNPENMFDYLKLEVGDAVCENSLRNFCETSVEQMEWLKANGVRFNSTLSPVKTSYPSNGHYLYYSGNEAQADYAEHAWPAQRGHRTFGKGLTGRVFFDALLSSAVRKGLKIYGYSDARRFIVSDSDEIEGIEIRQVDPESPAARKLKSLSNRFAKTDTLLFPEIAQRLVRRANAIVEQESVVKSIRIGKAAILATGGYIHNREMVRTYAPRYIGAIALGSIGCDGSGIRLGQSIGAGADRMASISAWRQFQPPRALATGIIVNARGERFVAEDCYGGTIGNAIAERADGKAYIIIDKASRKQALRQALPGRGKLFRLQGAPALMGLFLSTKKGRTIEELAERCGMNPATLDASVAHYNRACDGLEKPEFRKHPDFIGKITKPPFYAVDISIDNKRYLCTSISLGGIVVDEETGQVLDAQSRPIPKLYAAGKAAKGISSNRYVSGLSLADCVYSGRNAGRAAANDAKSAR